MAELTPEQVWGMPVSELTTEQLYEKLRILAFDPDEDADVTDWAIEHGADFAEAYAELDRRLSNMEILPMAWRWARTPN